MNSLKWLMAAALVLLAFGGCSSKGGVEGKGADGAAATAAGKGSGPRVNGYGEGNPYGRRGYREGGGAGSELDDPSGPLARRVIYFQYDSYEVAPEYLSVVTSHADYLASHPEQTAVLEGHADERGSPEYNIALGEARAKAVLRMMQLQGVQNGQLRILSYGEERPADMGHDESAWQQNRRVEISYPGH